MSMIIISIKGVGPGIADYTLSSFDPGDLGTARAEKLLPASLAAADRVNPLSVAEMSSRFQQQKEARDYEQIGEQLYGALAAALGAQVLSQQLGLPNLSRIELRIEDPALARLPWELLLGDDRLPVALRTPITRAAHTTTGPLPQLNPHSWPLRIMIVVGSDEATTAAPGQFEVLAEPEIEGIRRALFDIEALVDILVLRRPHRKLLMDEFVRFNPHVFHYIGHGGILGNEGYIEIRNAAGQRDQWGNRQITADLVGIRQRVPELALRLAFINACRSDSPGAGGLAPSAGPDNLWSIADAFLDEGVPAVLGMRSNVYNDKAAQFAKGFYESLALDRPLDLAVTDARRDVFKSPVGSPLSRDWAAPCLQLRSDPASTINLAAALDRAHRAQILGHAEFRRLRSLVDRRNERYTIWSTFIAQPRSLVVITGRGKIGKTQFAHMLMERCALFGHELRYIDLNSLTLLNFLDVLRAIRDGRGAQVGSLLRRSLAPEHFAEFNKALNRRLEASKPRPSAPKTEDWGAPLSDAAREKSELQKLFRHYQDALNKARGNRRLVLVLDHLASLTVHEFAPLKEHLFQHYANDQGVSFVLLLRPNEYDLFGMQSLQNVAFEMRLDGFSPGEWQELAMEFVDRMFLINDHGLATQQIKDAFLNRWRDHVRVASYQGPWSPEDLFNYSQLIRNQVMPL